MIILIVYLNSNPSPRPSVLPLKKEEIKANYKNMKIPDIIKETARRLRKNIWFKVIRIKNDDIKVNINNVIKSIKQYL